MRALTFTRRLFGRALWRHEHRSVPGESPVFTDTSPFQPTATNHAQDSRRATMPRLDNASRASAFALSELDFAFHSRARLSCAPNRVHLSLRSIGFSSGCFPQRLAASQLPLSYQFLSWFRCCAGSPTRRGCAAQRRTSALRLQRFGLASSGESTTHRTNPSKAYKEERGQENILAICESRKGSLPRKPLHRRFQRKPHVHPPGMLLLVAGSSLQHSLHVPA